jgi:xylose isomerase
MLARIQGADGVELCYPADFEQPAELKELLRQSGLGVAGVNFRARRTGKWWRGAYLYAEERPAQSAALLAKANRLFYVHLNDNDGRWDWDMLPGAFHLWEFVELFYTLRKLGYDNDWYAFDVYPKEIDTVANFAAAMTLTRKLEAITDRIDVATMERLLQERNSAKTLPYLYSLL